MSTPLELILPGRANPMAAVDARGWSRLVHVDESSVRRWLDAGLPVQSDGRIDIFSAINWLSWHALEECPVLARRWRSYLLFFAPFMAGQDRRRQIRWTRRHTLYLPRQAEQVQWTLPMPNDRLGQQVIRQELTADWCKQTAEVTTEKRTAEEIGIERTTLAVINSISGRPHTQTVLVSGFADITLEPQSVLPTDGAEHRFLAAIMLSVVGEFHYAYRHHHPDDYAAFFRDGQAPIARSDGSCLDAAMALGAAVADHGRRWRLVAGIVARSDIANPHYWIEVDTTAGWAPMDPTLPAIVRMLRGDWQTCARLYSGSIDARRVSLASAPIANSSSVGSTMGEVIARIDGQLFNAWPCIDWVCGECDAEFSELS